MPIQSLCSSTILLLLIGEENDDGAGDNISPFPVLAGASSGESPGRANKQMRNNDRYVEIVGMRLFGKQGEALLSHGNSLETKDIIINSTKTWSLSSLRVGLAGTGRHHPNMSHLRSPCYYRQLF